MCLVTPPANPHVGRRSFSLVRGFLQLSGAVRFEDRDKRCFPTSRGDADCRGVPLADFLLLPQALSRSDVSSEAPGDCHMARFMAVLRSSSSSSAGST